ncbi:MAG TPA: hypothetical protein VLU95_06875 [Candidatus Acidoferrum sp.]|nr:hypothetical protein [Candidatus Acidoferrum sp.]
MKKNKIIFVSITIAILILPCLCLSFVKATGETESIDLANSSMETAFTNVQAAQQVGANVTQLLARLNNGAVLLTQAINSYNGGNMANVTINAENARSIADQVNNDAINLKNNTINQSKNNFLLTTLLSVIAASIFVFLLVLVWRRFKRSYLNKKLALRPEGAENAS